MDLVNLQYDLKFADPSFPVIVILSGDDRVGYKIREASLRKLPYAIVVGERERDAGSINVRSRDRGELGEMSLPEFLASTAEENAPASLVAS